MLLFLGPIVFWCCPLFPGMDELLKVMSCSLSEQFCSALWVNGLAKIFPPPSKMILFIYKNMGYWCKSYFGLGARGFQLSLESGKWGYFLVLRSGTWVCLKVSFIPKQLQLTILKSLNPVFFKLIPQTRCNNHQVRGRSNDSSDWTFPFQPPSHTLPPEVCHCRALLPRDGLQLCPHGGGTSPLSKPGQHQAAGRGQRTEVVS